MKPDQKKVKLSFTSHKKIGDSGGRTVSSLQRALKIMDRKKMGIIQMKLDPFGIQSH